MSSWKNIPLGSCCKVIAGQSPEGKYYNDSGEGLPFYQGKKDFGAKFIGEPCTWTTQITKEALAGDVLMSVRAPVGPINFAIGQCCIGRGLAAIRASEKVDSDFLFYALRSKQSEISGNEGAVFASINKKQIEAIAIPLPPLPEQKSIVAILDEAFTGIDAAITNTEKNLANARELFESYLNAVFAEAYAGNRLVPLLEIATDITDGDHMPPPKSEAGVPFITIGNINKRTREVDFSDTFKVPREYFEGLKSNRKPQRGDILYTVTGSFGIPVIVEGNTEFCFQRHIGLIRPKANNDSRWLSYLLLSPQVFKQANERATGTAQKTVSLKVLRSITIPLVSQPKQREDADKLDAFLAEAQRFEAIYQHKLDALAELKQSILQKAFAGELSLAPEKSLEEAM